MIVGYMQQHSATHDFGPSASLAALEKRAGLLRNCANSSTRADSSKSKRRCSSTEIIPELHIEPIRTADGQFLQASPELHMKRLLAAGAQAIFQVTRSFRAGERGQLHNPEFTIVEWYRVGDDMQAGIDLLDELTQSLLGTPPALRTTYAEAFEQNAANLPASSHARRTFRGRKE